VIPPTQIQAQEQGLSLAATQSFMEWTQDSPPRVLVPHALYHNSTFSIKVILGKRWRAARGISIEDVWKSGINAYVVLESAPDLRVTSCSRCGKVPHPVVEINAKTMTDFGPLPFDLGSMIPTLPMQQTDQSRSQFVCGSAVLEHVSAMTETMMRSEDKQLELFCFDNCKTHCTSSRLHLGSRLILAMLFPTNVTSFSEPFELLSKKPRSKRRKDSTNDSKVFKPSVFQIPTAVSATPQMLAHPPLIPQQTSATQSQVVQQAPKKEALPPTVKSSLLDIAAAAAAVEEEIEAAQQAASAQAAAAAAANATRLSSQQEAQRQQAQQQQENKRQQETQPTQQVQQPPVMKKPRLCNPMS